MITLTFDDGLLNTHEVAFPILEKYGFKAVAFIIVGVVTGKKKQFYGYPSMNLEQIQELQQAGWEIGSHSVMHPLFERISLEEAENELVNSKEYLESNGFSVQSFAFPYGYGYYTAEQVSMAFKHYQYVRTVTTMKPQPNLIYGINIDDYSDYDEIPKSLNGSPKELKWKVYVMHTIRKAKNFEKWVSNMDEEVVTFRDGKSWKI